MAESIRDKVAIIGMGLSKGGERWDADIFDLITEASTEAFEDAGVDRKQIEACWVGYYINDLATRGTVVAQTLQLQQLPITRVENVCASGSEAIRGAAFGLASKQYDLVLALGFEKLKDFGFGGLVTAGAPGKVYPMYAAEQGAAPGRYAMAATAYFSNRRGPKARQLWERSSPALQLCPGATWLWDSARHCDGSSQISWPGLS